RAALLPRGVASVGGARGLAAAGAPAVGLRAAARGHNRKGRECGSGNHQLPEATPMKLHAVPFHLTLPADRPDCQNRWRRRKATTRGTIVSNDPVITRL